MSRGVPDAQSWLSGGDPWPLTALDQTLLAGAPLANYAALVLTEQLRRLARFSLTGERPGLHAGLSSQEHFARQHRGSVRVDALTRSQHPRGGHHHE